MNPKRTHLVRLTALLCVGLALAWWLPVAASAQSKAAMPSRVVAIGDVHGDYDSLVATLQRAGLLDAKLRWTGGKATLVQIGDFLDRGPRDRQVMDLLMALEKQAPKKGGRVVVVVGNHEVMNFMGDLRYVSPATYASYADKNSEKRRRAAYQNHVELLKAAAAAKGQPAPVFAPADEAAWMEAHPLGYVEQRQALSPQGKYGRWLRTHTAVERVGNILFVHGGISPALNATSVEAINKRIREEIAVFDLARDLLVQNKRASAFSTLPELLPAAQAELDARNAEIAQARAEAAAAGKTYQPDRVLQQQVSVLSNFLRLDTWYSVHPDGPLWYRGYETWSDAEGATQIPKLLAALHAQHIIVGHTAQRNGNIRMRFDGSIFLIDTGMLATHYPGGRASALEFDQGRFAAIYPTERIVLLDTRAPQTARPASAPDAEADDVPGGGLAQDPPQAPIAEPAKPRQFWYGADGQPLPFQTDEEILEFLRTARVVKVKTLSVGIAGTRKVLLEKDGIQANAAFRAVNEEKTETKLAGGVTEMFFRDSYIFECAAYELDKILGMNRVPPVVERRVLGEKGSLQIWIEGAMMESDRLKGKRSPPDPVMWNRQVLLMRVFDNLIYNTDRNMGNLLIDRNWRVWFIDHTRAFRRWDKLVMPNTIFGMERPVYERLKSLEPEEVRARLQPYLRKPEIDGILARRMKILERLEKLIRERGESEVLFTIQQ